MITLALDASIYTGTVAVWRDAELVAESAVAMRDRAAERLMPAVDDAVRAAGSSLGSIDRVICGAGPGSFTSLRIAASIAKGLCLARGIPLHVVSSLALIIAGNELAPGEYLAAIDALRGESYAAVVSRDGNGNTRLTTAPRLCLTSELAAMAERAHAALVGPEQAAMLTPHARGALNADPAVVDLASWEPAYGRLAEAQVKWEAAHGRPLPV